MITDQLAGIIVARPKSPTHTATNEASPTIDVEMSGQASQAIDGKVTEDSLVDDEVDGPRERQAREIRDGGT